MPDDVKRRWAAWVVAAALVGGALFGGGWWVARHIATTTANTQTAAANSQMAATDAQELKAASKQRTKELVTLQTEVDLLNQTVAGLKAGTAAEAQILTVAGNAIVQFDAQLKSICMALPGCVVQPFTLGTPTTTPPAGGG